MNDPAPKKPLSPTRKIVFGLLALLLALLLVEGALRLAEFGMKRLGWKTSPRYAPPPLIQPRSDSSVPPRPGLNAPARPPLKVPPVPASPGKRVTLGDVFEGRAPGDALFREDSLREFQKRRGLPDDYLIFRTNRFGFSGPEIDREPGPGVFRIMTLGDSCTVGGIEEYCYPRVLERELRKRGLPVEVVNAGGRGYTPALIRAQLPYLLSFKPRLVTLYVGWNALFPHPEWDWWETKSLTLRVLGNFLRGGKPSPPKRKCAFYWKAEKRCRCNPDFLPDLEKLVESLKQAGVEPVLITLPVLYLPERSPSKAALASGLPRYRQNAYPVACKVMVYNRALRRMAAKEKIPLIDLAGWSKSALTPREKYFIDAVHLNDLGTEKIGIYLAGALSSRLTGVNRSGPGGKRQ